MRRYGKFFLTYTVCIIITNADVETINFNLCGIKMYVYIRVMRLCGNQL